MVASMPSAAQAMPYMWAREKPTKMAMAMMMQGMMADCGGAGGSGAVSGGLWAARPPHAATRD